MGTPVAPSPGRWPNTNTDGCAMSKAAAVVNWLSKFASAFPDRSCTPLVATTVTVLDPGSNVPSGVSDTTRLSAECAMETFNLVPLASKPKVFELIVFGFSDLENVNTAAAFNPIPVAPLLGATETTCGAVVSATEAVVNELEKLTVVFLFPDKSCTPLTGTPTKTNVLPGSGVTCVNAKVVPLTAKLPASTGPKVLFNVIG